MSDVKAALLHVDGNITGTGAPGDVLNASSTSRPEVRIGTARLPRAAGLKWRAGLSSRAAARASLC